jgi:hypothetical protein
MRASALLAATLVLMACGEPPAPSLVGRGRDRVLLRLGPQPSVLKPVGCTRPRLGGTERATAVAELLRDR